MKEKIILSLSDVDEASQARAVISPKFSAAGVWSLWGYDSAGKRRCLEVGQSSNMRDEIAEDVEILLTSDEKTTCHSCCATYPAMRRFTFSQKFSVHMCRACTHRCENKIREFYASSNPRRVDKYRDIRGRYRNLFFCLVPDSLNQPYDRRIALESSYALMRQALYWYA